jgi:general secretion pathway protein K
MKANLPKRLPGTREDGVALAIVVWFIAGMSLLVAGIISHVRVDTRMTQLHVAQAQAASAGDGAIQLMLAELVSSRRNAPDGALSEAVYRLGSLDVEVTLVPAQGLIDINRAPQIVLAGLFRLAGALDATEAQTVADNVVKWRQVQPVEEGGKVVTRHFVALEDMLRVDGVSRMLIEAVRDYVVVGLGSQRGTNFSAAPAAVLEVLREANLQQAEQLLRQREQEGDPGSRGLARAASAAPGGMLRADAVVRYGDQFWLRRRWVVLETESGSSLPWRFQRTEAPRVVELSN